MFPELRAATAQRARELWLSRGSPDGQDLDFWLEAEREILARFAALEKTTPTKPSRPQRVRASVAADEIDEAELSDRLNDFGESGRRSPTSVEPT